MSIKNKLEVLKWVVLVFIVVVLIAVCKSGNINPGTELDYDILEKLGSFFHDMFTPIIAFLSVLFVAIKYFEEKEKNRFIEVEKLLTRRLEGLSTYINELEGEINGSVVKGYKYLEVINMTLAKEKEFNEKIFNIMDPIIQLKRDLAFKKKWEGVITEEHYIALRISYHLVFLFSQFKESLEETDIKADTQYYNYIKRPFFTLIRDVISEEYIPGINETNFKELLNLVINLGGVY